MHTASGDAAEVSVRILVIDRDPTDAEKVRASLEEVGSSYAVDHAGTLRRGFSERRAKPLAL